MLAKRLFKNYSVNLEGVQMIKGIYVAGSGMLTQIAKLDTITNNLANVNSTGYKKDIITVGAFSPRYYPQSSEIQLVSATQRIPRNQVDTLFLQNLTNYNKGKLKHTGNSLDIALDGDGFLVVNTPNGIRYTRNGNLSYDTQGILVTQDGFPVLGQSGPIKVSDGELKIDRSGRVYLDGQSIDTLQVVDFQKPYPLSKEGNGLFVLTDPTVRANQAQNTDVLQGSLESSNVDIITQMAEMIKTMRVYETYQKMVQSFDEAARKTNSELGKA